MSHELQEYTHQLSEDYSVPYELIFAMISIESDFQADLISSTNDYGLMQINKCNHKWLKDEYGITNFLDPEQNILCGIVMISSLYKKYESNVHKALMAYNMGEGGARQKWKNGITESKYSQKIVKIMKKLKGE